MLMLSVAILTLISVAAASPIQDATALADELLQAGSSSFDAKDAASLAKSYTEDGEITLLNKGEDGYQQRSYSGREAIRTLYADLFSNAGSIDSKNVVEYARFVGPDLMVIGGTFEPDIAGSLTLQFVQIRLKQDDGTWLIRELTLIPIPQP
jgi:ketosteroid isomerase-like protein